MHTAQTSQDQGLAPAICGGGEASCAYSLEVQAMLQPEPGTLELLARVEARLAEMADAEPVPADWTPSWSWKRGEEWQGFPWEQEARRREEIAPTIDHTPIVTLWDNFGTNARTMTAPLRPEEIWQPGPDLPETRRSAWVKWDADYKTAVARNILAAQIAADEPPKPKKVKKVKKAPAGGTINHLSPEQMADKAHKDFVAAEYAAIGADKKKHAERRARARRGRRRAYVAPTEHIHADRRYGPIDESFLGEDGVKYGYRTDLGIVGFKLWSSRVAQNALVGRNKRAVFRAKEAGLTPSELRDCSHVTSNGEAVLSQLVVDLDPEEGWPTLEALGRDLLRLLGPTLFPTKVIYRCDKRGWIEGAHVLWLLPPGSEVGVRGRSKDRPVHYFRTIQSALICHLMPLGADPGHKNSDKTKSPLDPHFSVACCENFPVLKDFSDGLPTVSADPREMRRRQAKRQGKDEDERSASGKLFGDVLEVIQAEYQIAFRSRSQKFLNSLASADLHASWLRETVTKRVMASVAGDRKAVERELAKQIKWRANNPPSMNSRQYWGENRYRDSLAHEEEGLVGAESPGERKAQGEERQRFAGTITRTLQGAGSRLIIREQVELFARIGGDISDDEAVVRFVMLSGKRQKTCVNKWLPVILADFRDASGYIANPDTGSIDPTSVASQAIEVAIVPAPATVLVSDATVASAAVATGNTGQPLADPSCRPAEPSSSTHACRRLPHHVGSPPSHSSTWMHWGGRRIDIDGDGVVHADHETVQ
ncbi:replication initiation protein [Bradyrhizobium sp. WSM1253]|uniref:replication initiation protein n=1 Tax=Bradyrhizobium sp. WSM1253 TaxID=319003 RepID=UPI00025D303F|nr:replication initiation protein [Bradyrhizobium sp. WSM1253]EIG62803.1 hypothetical protein Bra1253DRAFT_07739 [Bradyrhizobium sp. WSM1253]